MKRKKRYIVLSTLLIGILCTTTAYTNKYQNVVKKLALIEKIIEEEYIGEINAYKLQEGIYKGFINGLGDTYGTYYTNAEYEALGEDISGTYKGIGIRMYLDQEENKIIIKEVFDNTPAQKAGLIPDDQIIKFAGKSVSGSDYNYVVDCVANSKDKALNLTVYRPSEQKMYPFQITKENIVYPSVYFNMVDEDIAKIQITRFEETTYDQFKEALMQSEAENAKGIILDLRNNPGGLLRIARDIANALLPEGVIVSTRDKAGKVVEYESDPIYIDTPMVVLINGNSASASEVVAGALKDYQRAKLIGETSFGKGIVQTIIPLSDGSAIKLTTSQYFTPNGTCIQDIGIEPDVPVALPIEKMLRYNSLEAEEDDQLQKAIEVLKESSPVVEDEESKG